LLNTALETTYTIVYSSTDLSGNTGSTTRIVTVSDAPPQQTNNNNGSSRRRGGGGGRRNPIPQVLGAATTALTDAQINAILSLLKSFGADQDVVNKVTLSLKGQVPPTITPPTGTTPAPVVLGASTHVFVETLRKGSYSAEVGELQKRLTAEGLYSGPITTFFGPLTEAAVKAYQTKYGIPPTGVVGPLTRAKLNSK
jgi:hypothetical protein